MSKHLELVDAVNDAKTQHDHDVAYARLRGYRDALSEYLPSHYMMLIEADMHTMAKHGEDAAMCCGVLLDWCPEDQQAGKGVDL